MSANMGEDGFVGHMAPNVKDPSVKGAGGVVFE